MPQRGMQRESEGNAQDSGATGGIGAHEQCIQSATRVPQAFPGGSAFRAREFRNEATQLKLGHEASQSSTCMSHNPGGPGA
eukprot:15468058-Alexandrium_andersonii.AAC.1